LIIESLKEDQQVFSLICV